MQKRRMASDGPEVTAVGFGAWAIGGLGYGKQDDKQAAEALDAYLDGGGRLIDTARGYGVSEILVGKALKRFGRREEVYLASKSGSTHPPIARTDLETSLFCLQAGAVDLYYIHVPPPDPDKLDALLAVYDSLKQAGKTRQVGVSLPPMRSDDHYALAGRILADPRVDVVQIPHSFAGPQTGELIQRAAERGLGVLTRMNMLGGILTGKYEPGHRFDDPGNDWRASLNGPHLDRALAIVQSLAAEVVQPPYENLSELALAWSLHAPGVTAIIPGGRRPEQVRANLRVDQLPAPDGDVREALEQAGREIAEQIRQARGEASRPG
ncbi:MAG: aldo/keto reductase [Phycisphaerae bacterium]